LHLLLYEYLIIALWVKLQWTVRDNFFSLAPQSNIDKPLLHNSQLMMIAFLSREFNSATIRADQNAKSSGSSLSLRHLMRWCARRIITNAHIYIYIFWAERVQQPVNLFFQFSDAHERARRWIRSALRRDMQLDQREERNAPL